MTRYNKITRKRELTKYNKNPLFETVGLLFLSGEL